MHYNMFFSSNRLVRGAFVRTLKNCYFITQKGLNEEGEGVVLLSKFTFRNASSCSMAFRTFKGGDHTLS